MEVAHGQCNLKTKREISHILLRPCVLRWTLYFDFRLVKSCEWLYDIPASQQLIFVEKLPYIKVRKRRKESAFIKNLNTF